MNLQNEPWAKSLTPFEITRIQQVQTNQSQMKSGGVDSDETLIYHLCNLLSGSSSLGSSPGSQTSSTSSR